MTRYWIIGLSVAIALIVLVYVSQITGRVAVAQTTQPGDPVIKTTALSNTVTDIDGKTYELSQLKGKVVLIVNVASKCGFTPQYEDLEKIYLKYKDQGLVIIGFPCNQFGGQEPGTAEEIKTFCSTKYNVTFPLMSKIDVNGAEKSPVYKALNEGTGKFAGNIKWNFEKFLIGRDGETLLGRFGSRVKPTDPAITNLIESELKAK